MSQQHTLALSIYLLCCVPSLTLHLSSFNVLEFQESASTLEFLFYFCSLSVPQAIHFYGNVKFKPLACSVLPKFKFVCLNVYSSLLLKSLMCISNRMPGIGHGSLAQPMPLESQPLLIEAKPWTFLSQLSCPQVMADVSRFYKELENWFLAHVLYHCTLRHHHCLLTLLSVILFVSPQIQCLPFQTTP